MSAPSRALRALTSAERAVLRLIVSGLDEPPRGELLAQVDLLYLAAGSSANWIKLIPAAIATPVPNLGDALEIAVDVLSADGDVCGGIRLHEEAGFLSTINLFLLSGKEPTWFPSPDQIRVHPWRARPLTDDERAVLTLILENSGHPERRTLLAQVPFLSVTASSIATWTYLIADPAAVPAIEVNSPINVNADVMDAAGEAIGGLLVWVDDGLISAIEYFWYRDDRPEIFPRPEQVRFRPIDVT